MVSIEAEPDSAINVNESVALTAIVLESNESKLSMEAADMMLDPEGMVVAERELLEDGLLVEERNVVYEEELVTAVNG